MLSFFAQTFSSDRPISKGIIIRQARTFPMRLLYKLGITCSHLLNDSKTVA